MTIVAEQCLLLAIGVTLMAPAVLCLAKSYARMVQCKRMALWIRSLRRISGEKG